MEILEKKELIMKSGVLVNRGQITISQKFFICPAATVKQILNNAVSPPHQNKEADTRAGIGYGAFYWSIEFTITKEYPSNNWIDYIKGIS